MSATDTEILPLQVIQPRRRRFDFDAVDDRYWIARDPFQTRFFDAFSTLLPIGERFFISALRRVESKLTDPQLVADIKGLVEQEAIHAREHRRYNDRLRSAGFDVDAMDRSQARYMGRMERAKNHHLPLAVTVACEHVTAVMGRAMLQGRLIDADAHPVIHGFWSWHAAEEIEHKDVAIRAYRSLGGSELLRFTALVWVMLIMTIRMTSRVTRMLVKDRRIFDPRVWFSGARFLLGRRRGFFKVVLPDILEYFNRGFDPGATDDRDLLNRWAVNDPYETVAAQAGRSGQTEHDPTSPDQAPVVAGSSTDLKVVPARLGLLFEALEHLGENMHFTIELRDLDGSVLGLHDIHHKHHDGYGALITVLARHGIACDPPPTRAQPPPTRRERLAAFRAAMRGPDPSVAGTQTRPHTGSPGEGRGRLSVGVLLDGDRSERVRAAAAAAQVSTNSWMLSSLNRIVAPHLTKDPTVTWGITVNMRGSIAVDPPLANCSSVVPVTMEVGATPAAVHSAVRSALRSNLHWGKWDQVNLMGRLGRRGALRQIRRYYKTTGIRVGAFSNVGSWSGDAPPGVGIIAHGVPTKADPLFATAASFNDLIGLSLRMHPSVEITPAELGEWLDQWVENLTCSALTTMAQTA